MMKGIKTKRRRGKTPVFRAPHRAEQTGVGGGTGVAAARPQDEPRPLRRRK